MERRAILIYIFQKVFHILRLYILVLMIVFLPLYILHNGKPSMLIFINNLCAIDTNIMGSSVWYIHFYVLAMLTLPFYLFVQKRCSVKVMTSIGILGLYILRVIIHFIRLIEISQNNVFVVMFYEYTFWMPCLLIGILLTEEFEFENMVEKRSNWVIIIVSIVLFLLRIYTGIAIFSFNLDMIYGALFIGIFLLFIRKELKINKVFMELGKKSTYIWFIHCLFLLDDIKVFNELYKIIRVPIFIYICLFSIAIVIVYLFEKFENLLIILYKANYVNLKRIRYRFQKRR